MAKKKFKFKYKFFLDAPVPVFFVMVSALVFIIDCFLLKDRSSVFLTFSPTTPDGSLPFLISKPISYLRLFLYVFGFASPQLLITDLIFIMLLGPSIEERYGSIVIGIMMAVSALFSGVLNACFCATSLRGASCIIFMLIFLNSFMTLSKKKIPVSFIFVLILYVLREFFEKKSAGAVGILICIAGGLCGSLFAFLTSPKARAEKKTSAREAFLEELDSQSPRNRKKNQSNDDDDGSTVVGTIKF